MKTIATIAATALFAVAGFTESSNAEVISKKDEDCLYGVHCIFCNGSGFNGPFNCQYCKGTGRNSSY